MHFLTKCFSGIPEGWMDEFIIKELLLATTHSMIASSPILTVTLLNEKTLALSV